MSPLSGAFGLRSSTNQVCVIMGTWTPVCGVTPEDLCVHGVAGVAPHFNYALNIYLAVQENPYTTHSGTGATRVSFEC
jgi:hypothetical protein